MVRLSGVFVCRAAALVLGAAVAGLGCAQLVGIDDTTNAKRIDTLTVMRRSIGATVETAPLELTGLEATYFVAHSDAAGVIDRVDAQPGADPGTWTTQLHNPAPVRFTLPGDAAALDGLAGVVTGPSPQLYAFPRVRLSVVHSVLQHPDATSAPAGATFSVTTPLDAALAATDSFQTYVVGAWLRRPFVASELPAAGATQIGPVTFGFTAAHSVAGLSAPDLVTGRDAFLVLRYAGSGLTGVARTAAPVEQTAMATTVTTEPMVAVVQDQTFDATLSPETLAQRYMAVVPAVQSLSMSWSLVAAPGYQSAFNAGPALQSGLLAMTDVGVSVKYGNPFVDRDWRTIFTLATSESRTYPATGMAPAVTLSAGMSQFLAPASGAALTLPASLPTTVRIAGVALATDGQAIAAPTGFVPVTFDTDAQPVPPGESGPFYSLQVFDLVTNQAGTAIDRHLVLTAASSEPAFALAPETFQAGHLYTLRAITTLGGYPKLGEGSFVERQLPLAQSYLDSAAFQVMP